MAKSPCEAYFSLNIFLFFLSSNPWCDSFLSFSRSGPINSVFYEQNFNTDQNFCKSQLIIWYTIINQGYLLPDNLCQVGLFNWRRFWNFLSIEKNQFCGDNNFFLSKINLIDCLTVFAQQKGVKILFET